MLSVRMLGPFAISVDGRRLSDDLGASGRNFASFLFQFIGLVHRREKLADQFWGHLDPDRARAALNTALWRLRKLLASDRTGGNNLHTHGSEIILETAPWLSVDSIDFSARVTQSLDQRNVDEPTRMSALGSAVASYAGPFMDGDDSEWILPERERLHSLFVRAGMQIIRDYGATERYDEAIGAARRLLLSDPFREVVHRDLIILLVLNGQRVDALRHHQRLTSLFKRELDIEPMPETLRLVDEIRSGTIFSRLCALKAQHFQSTTTSFDERPGASQRLG